MTRDSELPLAVQIAEEVMTMHRQLEHLTAENEELRQYRKKYIELLNSNISHDRHMMGGLLDLALKPGVLDAISTANKNIPN